MSFNISAHLLRVQELRSGEGFLSEIPTRTREEVLYQSQTLDCPNLIS